MALTQVTGPYPIFTDLDGSPLDDGYLYIGASNQDPETNPIQVYWDSGLTIPATQPIRTNSGYAWRNGTPALLYTAGEFSITIRNKRHEFVLYSPLGYGFDPAAVSASVVKNDFIGDGVEVDFTLSASPSTKLATNAFINGVYQEKDSYSLNGNVITFSVAPPLASSIEILTNETGVINSGNANDISYTLNEPGATLQSVQTKLEQYISVKDFGAVGDGVTDDTAAIQAAIDASYTNFNKTVHVPNGVYKLTDTITITQGVMIVGEGSQGSNEAYGTVFKHYSNNSCFRWDGSGTAYAGTGGGLKNCLIVKADGYSGGNAVEVIATSNSQRPGEMVFHNVLAYGLSSGRWTRGLVVDGTACNTPGSRGVRTVYMTKCRFADVTTADETILLNQVTHFYTHGLAVDTGSGASGGITLQGINDGLYFNALGCAGTFTVVPNDANNATDNLIVDGKLGGSFDNQDTDVNGVVCLATNSGVANRSTNLRVVAGKKPGCFVYANANVANITGDATDYQMALNASVFDPFGNWGGNSFTVTVAGRYKVMAMATLTNLGAAHTRADMQILQTGSAVNSVVAVSNPYANSTATGGNNSLTVTGDFDCEYGDILTAKIAVTGGTKTVSLVGSGGTRYSYFIAEYIP